MQLAKRALITLLLASAATYKVVVNVTRDSVDADVLKAFRKSIKNLQPVDKKGPWHIFCNNEGFLHAGDATKLYRKLGNKMWHVPRRSPDLNPIELL